MVRQRVPGLHATVIALALGPSAGAEDCNSNGVEDREEIAARFVRDCNANGIPDGCDAQLEGADVG